MGEGKGSLLGGGKKATITLFKWCEESLEVFRESEISNKKRI